MKLNRWEILRLATDSKSYLPYASLLYSDGKKIATCSGEAYAQFDIELPFKGCVDFKLFSHFFKDFGENGTKLACKNNKVIITRDTLKTTLAIHNQKFPFIYPAKTEGIEITDEIIDCMKLKTKLGSESQNTLINRCGIFTTGVWYFCHTNLSFPELGEEINFKNKFIKALEGGAKLTKIKGKISIIYEDGFFMFPEEENFITEDVIQRGRERIKEVEEKGIKIESVAKLTQLIKEIRPILATELEKRVKIEITKKNINIIARSFDGESIYKLKNSTGIENREIELDLRLLKIINDDFILRVLDDWKLFSKGNFRLICK